MNAGILFFDMNGEKYIMEQYYYNHMTKTEQEVYYGIMNGVTNYDTSILLPALDIKDVQNVFFLMRLDHPEIFYVTGFKYSYYRDSPNIIFTPEYLFEKAKIKEHQKALKARIDKLALKAKNECKTELEKELFIRADFRHCVGVLCLLCGQCSGLDYFCYRGGFGVHVRHDFI